jgi:hypothetical protein
MQGTITMGFKAVRSLLVVGAVLLTVSTTARADELSTGLICIQGVQCTRDGNPDGVFADPTSLCFEGYQNTCNLLLQSQLCDGQVSAKQSEMELLRKELSKVKRQLKKERRAAKRLR